LTRLEGIRQALLAHHLGGSTLPNAAKGGERETFVRDFLEQLFPSPFRFGSGAITDSASACSGQIDIVVEYPFLPSFPMPGGSERLYLAEFVAAALEVKSDISAQWSQVEHSVQLLRPVRRRWQGSTRLMGSGIAFGLPSDSPVPYVAAAFTGYSSIETLKKKLDDTPPDRRPDGVLVIQSGAFVGPGCEAYGALGLYGLAVVLTNLVRAVSSAEADIGAYVAAHVK
jgi:uncharacterized protein DUF6602